MRTFLTTCTIILFLINETIGVVTPPKIIYGGWKPILPGHPFYFGARDNNVPNFADTNTHQYIHEGPVQYVEQVIHPTKYALLPEKVLRSAKHVSKDIFSYYPRSVQGPETPSQDMGYKPIYIELPRKPLELFENPTNQNSPNLHQTQHAGFQLQKSKIPQNNQLFEQTFLKITPLVDSNGQTINPQDVQIRPYLVPLPPNSPMGLNHQNSVSLSLDKMRHHANQQQHLSDRPYLSEMQYIEQNEIPSGGEPLSYKEQVMEMPMPMDVPLDIPQQVMEQPVYQDAIQNTYASRSLKPTLDSSYFSLHQNQILPELNHQPQFRFADAMKHQFRHFEKQPIIYHMKNEKPTFKTEHQPIMQYHNRNRFTHSDLLLPAKYHYKVTDEPQLREPQLIIGRHTDKYNPFQNLNDINSLRMHHKPRIPPRIIYKEIETPKPQPIYHIQSAPKYVNKEVVFKKQAPNVDTGDLTIIHIPLGEYLRLKASENLLKKETLIVTAGSKQNSVHQPTDYQLENSNKNLHYVENQDQSNEVPSYGNSFAELELGEKYNMTANELNDHAQFGDNNGGDPKDQVFHAYYAPADHDPPEGYVKMTVNEFDKMFKNAEIRYVDKAPDTKISDETNSNDRK